MESQISFLFFQFITHLLLLAQFISIALRKRNLILYTSIAVAFSFLFSTASHVSFTIYIEAFNCSTWIQVQKKTLSHQLPQLIIFHVYPVLGFPVNESLVYQGTFQKPVPSWQYLGNCRHNAVKTTSQSEEYRFFSLSLLNNVAILLCFKHQNLLPTTRRNCDEKKLVEPSSSLR